MARFAVAALAALAPLALLALLARWLPMPLDVIAALSFTAAALAIVAAVSLAPLEALARPRVGAMTVALGVLASVASLALPPVAAGLLGSLGVIACGASLGVAVGVRVAAPGHLLAVAMLSAAVDLWSVTAPSGVTRHIVANPLLLQLLTVRAALPSESSPQPLIGFGDVVFAALYTAAGARFGLSARRTVGALAVGLLVAGAAAMLIGAPGGVPALPFLGAAFVVAQPGARVVAEGDRRAMWAIGAALVAAIVHLAMR